MAVAIEALEKIIPQQCSCSYEKYLGIVDWDIELAKIGTVQRVRIPRIYLWGTQERTTYSRQKERIVVERMQRCGYHCLEQHPITSCGIPTDDGLVLAVVDGHHRVRYSGRFGIDLIPTINLTPDQLAQVYRNAGVESNVNGGILQERLLAVIDEVSESFRLPPSKFPQLLPFAKVEDLASNFISFKGGE